MLESLEYIFFIGIKGVGMSNLALMLKKMGRKVSGCDTDEVFITDDWLKKNNIEVLIGFETLPEKVELVVYSAAHGGGQNPLVLEAKKRNIKVMHQAEFIGELMEQFKTKVAVTGSHGKTTTASLLAYALIKLGAKPTYLVGSSDFNGYPAGDFGTKDIFVTEADEYAVDPPHDKTPKFMFLNPDIILSTNIDFDHPDVYENFADAKNKFEEFFKLGKTVIKADELKIEEIKVNGQGTSFTFNDALFEISLYGEKNAQNAAGVISVLLKLGFAVDQIKAAIKDFTGAKRRFELKFSQGGTYLFDDYGHHPQEIEATINAARMRFPGKRIIIVFQPHTYSRTQSLLSDFSKSLAKANFAYVLPIFSSARENPQDFSVTSHDIAKGENVIAVDSRDKISPILKENVRRGDVVFTMGAGDVYKLENDIIDVLGRL